jgi:hypothetical protein
MAYTRAAVERALKGQEAIFPDEASTRRAQPLLAAGEGPSAG